MDRRSFLAALAALAPRPHQARRAAPASGTARVETLRSVRGVPAEIVGLFREPAAFEQAASGQYFVFDRLGHAVYGIDAELTGAWPLVRIGREPGRIIDPTAFALAAGAPIVTFVVADRPGAAERLQFFGRGGNLLGGFSLPRRAGDTITVGSIVLNGIGSVQYDGSTIFLNQPDTGALIAQYSPAGVPIRTFGPLRATAHESDRELHLALNTGLPVLNPSGGFYFVFQTGVPLFRKYGPDGAFLFERHIEGPEIDGILNALPTTWPTRRVSNGRELPVVPPVVRAARADGRGRLWVSFAGVPFTYVYDSRGEKIRTVQFRGAGLVSPVSLFFAAPDRLLVTPGCYEFKAA